MASYNKVVLVGNLTRDPEIRYTPKGTAVATLGLAVNRKWRTESGEEREEVLFVDVDAFGRTAENIGEYMRKGSPLLIEGRLKLDQWDDKQTGQKRSKVKVVCETCQFLNDGKGRSEPTEPPDSGPGQRSYRPPAGSAAARGGDDSFNESPQLPEDDVPF